MPTTITVPPNAPAPNYVNPPTRAPAAQITGIALAFLVAITTAFRLYTRLRVSVSWGLDDLFAVAGMVCHDLSITNHYSQ